MGKLSKEAGSSVFTFHRSAFFQEHGTGEQVLQTVSPVVNGLTIGNRNSRSSLAKIPDPYQVPNSNWLSGIRKIAVVVSNDMSGFIFALPALHALRNSYPNAEIVLLGSEWHCQLLAGRPAPINRVEILPFIHGITGSHSPENRYESAREIDLFIERMRQEKFDIAIQLQGNEQSTNLFIHSLGAHLTVGSGSPESDALDRSLPYSYYQLGILHFLEVVSLVGAQSAELEPRLVVIDSDLFEAERAILDDGSPIAVIAPGAADPRRGWPIEKFASVGNLIAWSGAKVVIAGQDEDAEVIEAVIRNMSADAINLCGQLSPRGLVGLLAKARVVISNDSGVLHLANAVGASTVGIYWCGSLLNTGPVTGAKHRITISWQLNCPVCGLNCTRTNCGHMESFLADISQEEVAIPALEFLRLDDRPSMDGYDQREINPAICPPANEHIRTKIDFDIQAVHCGV